jgi:hypothetical protein
MDEEKVREFRRISARNRRSWDRLASQIQVHFIIKSPIFVQLIISEQSITTNNISNDSQPDAYIPRINDIRSKDLATSELIAQDIEQTTKALLLNPKSYQMDACDIFVSQVITPISVYNTYLASGTLDQWIEFTKRTNLPGPIEEYRSSVENCLKAEWPSFRDLFNDEKKTKR